MPERHNKTERIDRLYSTAERGQSLEIMDLKTCLGIVAYDKEEMKMYGVHMLNIDKDSVISFLQTIPKDRRGKCSYLTFGSIPMPGSVTSELPESNFYKEDNYYESLIKALEVIETEHKDKIIYRDSKHFPQLKQYSDAGLLGNPNTGEVVLFGRKKDQTEYDEIDRVTMM